jgi:arginine/lysine/ornithine decarboxylase
VPASALDINTKASFLFSTRKDQTEDLQAYLQNSASLKSDFPIAATIFSVQSQILREANIREACNLKKSLLQFNAVDAVINVSVTISEISAHARTKNDIDKCAHMHKKDT